VDETCLEDVEELGLPPQLSVQIRVMEFKAKDALTMSLRTHLKSRTYRRCRRGDNGQLANQIRIVNDTSMAAEELSRTLQAASEVVDSHIL